MLRKDQLHRFILRTIGGIAVVIAASVFAPAQNTVPPTARQAAASPQFAPSLAHRATAPRKASRRAHTNACSAQRYEPLPLPQTWNYANGPSNGLCDIQGCTVDAWTINFGYAVSNTIGSAGAVTTLNIAAWMLPGDQLLSLDWSLGSYPFGSDLGYGTSYVSQQLLFPNQFGYDIDQVTATGVNGSISAGNWVTLQNAATVQGNPVYWDENSGPSLADDNNLGTIPSESFNAAGGGNACMPEQQGNFKVIHDFNGQGDGTFPVGVIMDKAGNLYGTTQPYYANGSVYKLAHEGTGWLLDPLYQFSGAGNGATPEGLALGANGVLYGAVNGGVQGCSGGYCGSIFSLKPLPSVCRSGLCNWAENVLYNFSGPTDAWAGTELVTDQAGNLYGISESGGANAAGAVFELTPAFGGWSEKILYSFTGGTNGIFPTTLLASTDGNLYGATAQGAPTAAAWFSV